MTVAVNAHTHTHRDSKEATLAGPQRCQDYQLLAQKSFNPLRGTERNPSPTPKRIPFTVGQPKFMCDIKISTQVRVEFDVRLSVLSALFTLSPRGRFN